MGDPLTIVEHKFRLPHWLFMREFRNGTGFSATRSADALVVGLYASRGQLLIGFEQKVSRSDWLRELNNAEKAEDICKHCDHWNIVVPELGIVQLEELPPTWGLILATGNRLKTIKTAPKLQSRPVSRNFMAAIIKRGIEEALKPHLLADRTKIDQAEKEGFERGKLSAALELARATKLQESVNEFEAASGIKINQYSNGRQLGAAVNALINSDTTVRRARNDLSRTVDQMRDTISIMEKHLAHLGQKENTTNGNDRAGETTREQAS